MVVSSVGGMTNEIALKSATHIDCDTCAVRGLACHDCVVTVLLGPPPELLEADEVRALDVLAAGGLVPPLRHVIALDGPEIATA